MSLSAASTTWRSTSPGGACAVRRCGSRSWRRRRLAASPSSSRRGTRRRWSARCCGHALLRYRHDDYRLYVGCYPNDRATIDAVAAVVADDPRVRLVVGPREWLDQPSRTALNTSRGMMRRADAADDRATAAVVLHDAEDWVDPLELALFDRLLGDHALVQLPVVPLLDRHASLIAGTYADEFAESHGRTLVVRGAIGAAMPLGWMR
ncbi:glycosyltransferase [Sphingomonas sp. MMS24-JH45]